MVIGPSIWMMRAQSSQLSILHLAGILPVTTFWPGCVPRCVPLLSVELYIEDGIVLKGSEQVLIPRPAAMQEYILDALHAGHQGRDKCQLRAKRSVFWNGINDDIAKCVSKCPICQEEASSQPKELWCKKTFHHEHGAQSARISLTSWEKNTCSWLTIFHSSPLSSACPGTVSAKQPRRP